MVKLFFSEAGPRAAGYARTIRTLRAYRRMGQKELAEKSGYSIASVILWEAGKVEPAEAARIDLAQSFKVPLRVFDWLAATSDPLSVDFLVPEEQEDPGKLYFRAEEVCAEAGVCMNTFYKIRKVMKVKAKRMAGQLWYTRDDIEAIRWESHRRARMKSEKLAESALARHEYRRQHGEFRSVGSQVRRDDVQDVHVVRPEEVG